MSTCDNKLYEVTERVIVDIKTNPVKKSIYDEFLKLGISTILFALTYSEKSKSSLEEVDGNTQVIYLRLVDAHFILNEIHLTLSCWRYQL